MSYSREKDSRQFSAFFSIQPRQLSQVFMVTYVSMCQQNLTKKKYGKLVIFAPIFKSRKTMTVFIVVSLILYMTLKLDISVHKNLA